MNLKQENNQVKQSENINHAIEKNTIVIASAGSRKTTYLVEEVLKMTDERVLISTFTNANVDLIQSYIVEKHGFVPKNIEIMSWYKFLLRECVRPYFNQISSLESVENIYFEKFPKEKMYVPKKQVDKYYFTKTRKIYKDRVSDFVCNCNKTTEGLVINRLEKIYKHIFIDEVQDFRGYDFDFLDEIAKSNIKLFVVGDPRQMTLATNNSGKKTDILKWRKLKEKDKSFIIKEKNECYRSNKEICEFADKLYPDMAPTISKNDKIMGHDGVFVVGIDDLDKYVETYNPQILRYNQTSNCYGYNGVNIRVSKGNTYDRVLIVPTNPMKEFLFTADITKAGTLSTYYVALTRARYSVAILVDKKDFGKLKFKDIIKVWQQE